ncbi:MAG: NAD(P)H-dependent oxidoreductase [Candidatus Thorarchaeota archaeon]|nr:NAD(P)H-dependent oxidoreductase [Candidatus Thorarchaeota archaeon]
MSTVNFLLLSGSSRGKTSTSYSLLEYLKTQLESLGKSCELSIAHKIMRKGTDFENFSNLIDSADYLIVTMPLYVDSLPSHVIETFTRLLKTRGNNSFKGTPKFLAIVNSGFPEQHQNLLALQICQQFAQEANLDWIGGIPFGGGALIGGSPLDSSGGRGKQARFAMEILAKALSEDKEVPEECISRINKLMIPKRIYMMMGNFRWRKQSGSNKVRDRLNDQPFLASE